ncbi:hypothetical protein LSH36_501g01137 [Paralvinella palmiformis]|uniref:General transcription factor IIH subunit 4 n=1 Tax=Paralvinella palmiformis TaxID=53620 RepID=A0AAD9MWI0_9ANNE|nr:hypothetical protein LSH36_501g01137 [Paralvinella palmiformis]
MASGSRVAGKQQLECKDFRGYLKTLPVSALDKLYCHPATCLAIFRDLPLLARHYVMRLLFVEQPVSHTVVAAWVGAQAHSMHTKCTEILTSLRVWHEHSLPGGLPGWLLNEVFRTNLKVALLGGGDPWTGAGALNPDKHAKDTPFLENYAIERWECVLHYMVGSCGGAGAVSRDVVDILHHAGLMKSEGQESYITPAGFQFLLLDTATQVWYFMMQYLDTVETRNMELVECLTFLFQLSFSTLGKDYSTEGMSDNQQRLLQHLREFGLVYQRKRKSQRYYPTHLAINLASAVNKPSTHTPKLGYIIVETNYRVYAYTESPLQVALLALFCEMLYRFPNLAIGNITRDRVRKALQAGITADQRPVLPPTISDQIRLWELERDRFKFTDGVLYNQFLSQSDFELLRDYAKDIGVLVWDNAKKRVMIVTRAGHDDVRRFWKHHKP